MLLHKPQGDGTRAHAGELPGIPGVEGHAMHRLKEAGERQELIGSHAPQGQSAVKIVPWGGPTAAMSAPRGPR